MIFYLFFLLFFLFYLISFIFTTKCGNSQACFTFQEGIGDTILDFSSNKKNLTNLCPSTVTRIIEFNTNGLYFNNPGLACVYSTDEYQFTDFSIELFVSNLNYDVADQSWFSYGIDSTNFRQKLTTSFGDNTKLVVPSGNVEGDTISSDLFFVYIDHNSNTNKSRLLIYDSSQIISNLSISDDDQEYSPQGYINIGTDRTSNSKGIKFYSIVFNDFIKDDDEINDDWKLGSMMSTPMRFEQPTNDSDTADEGIKELLVFECTTYGPVSAGYPTYVEIMESPASWVELYDQDELITIYPYKSNFNEIDFLATLNKGDNTNTTMIKYRLYLNDTVYGPILETDFAFLEIEVTAKIDPPEIYNVILQDGYKRGGDQCQEISNIINISFIDPLDQTWLNIKILDLSNNYELYDAIDCSGIPIVNEDLISIDGSYPDYTKSLYFNIIEMDDNVNSFEFNCQVVTSNTEYSNNATIEVILESILNSTFNSTEGQEAHDLYSMLEFEDFNGGTFNVNLTEINRKNVPVGLVGEMQMFKDNNRIYNGEQFGNNESLINLVFKLSNSDVYGVFELIFLVENEGISKEFKQDFNFENIPSSSDFTWFYKGDELDKTGEKIKTEGSKAYDFSFELTNPDFSTTWIEIELINSVFHWDQDDFSSKSQIIGGTLQELEEKSPITVTITNDDKKKSDTLTFKVNSSSDDTISEGILEFEIEHKEGDDDDDDVDDNLPYIIGGAGGAGGLIIISAIIILVVRKRRNREPELPPPPDFEPFIYGSALEASYDQEQKETLQKIQPLTDLLFEEDNELVYALIKNCSSADLDSLSTALTYLLVNEESFEEIINELIRKEVKKASETKTLFRSNDAVSKMLKVYSKMIGLPYLYQTLGVELFKIYNELQEYDVEVDEAKVEDPENTFVESNRWFLLASAQGILNKITHSQNDAPYQFRQICNFLKIHVRKKFDDESAGRAIGGFIFLRVFCPAITTPESYGLVPDAPTEQPRRHLVLVAKTLQNAANGTNFKEDHMKPLSVFIKENQERIDLFFERISIIPDETDSIVDPPVIPQIVLNSSLAAIYRIISTYWTKIKNDLSEELKSYLDDLLSDIGDYLPKKVTKI